MSASRLLPRRRARRSLEDQAASEETEAYWLYASAPDKRPFGRGAGSGLGAQKQSGAAKDEQDAGEKTREPVSSGKWMVFVYEKDLDASWALIKSSTEKGALGPVSKTSTGRENPLSSARGTKVIIVYTSDADDQADVRRVLAELRRLGFSGRLNYKLDADTGRLYGAGAALYTSPERSLEFHMPKSRR